MIKPSVTKIFGESPACNRLPTMGITTIEASALGISDSPTIVGVKPNTRCSKSGYTNTEVKSAKPETKNSKTEVGGFFYLSFEHAY